MLPTSINTSGKKGNYIYIIMEKHGFPGTYSVDGKLYTQNSIQGQSLHMERLRSFNGVQYRSWEPDRSKLSAMVKKGHVRTPLENDSRVLYLGAGHGTTVSYLSDIILNGRIHAVEFSRRAFRDLLEVAKRRENINPIMGDAREPQRYRIMVGSPDIIYQDISQRDQVKIFLKNVEGFPSAKGGYLFVKARSIDVSLEPRYIYKNVVKELRDNGLKVDEVLELGPYQKDHAGIVWSR